MTEEQQATLVKEGAEILRDAIIKMVKHIGDRPALHFSAMAIGAQMYLEAFCKVLNITLDEALDGFDEAVKKAAEDNDDNKLAVN